MDPIPFTVSSMLGSQVYTEANEVIGRIVDIFLDPDDLEVTYLLLSVNLPSLGNERLFIIHGVFFTFSDSAPHLRVATTLQFGMLDKIPKPLPSMYADSDLSSFKDFIQQIVPLLSVAGHQSDV